MQPQPPVHHPGNMAADGRQSQATPITATAVPWASNVPTETLASFASRGANILQTEQRATTLQQMLALGSLVETVLNVYKLIDSSQYSATCGQRILWNKPEWEQVWDEESKQYYYYRAGDVEGTFTFEMPAGFSNATVNMYHICDHFVSPPLETLLCTSRLFCEALSIAAP